MIFESTRLKEQFPELYGFVLMDPMRLDSFYQFNAKGMDLLTRFTQTDDGDRVCREGIAIPITNIDEGDYSITIRDSQSPGLDQPPHALSKGWIIGTETGKLIFTGLGYLIHWDPNHTHHVHIQVPPGWYQVNLSGYRLDEDSSGDDGLYDFALTPSSHKPAFTANMATLLGLFCDKGNCQ